jgi:DNA-directed RNA polymerase sigma subunit (sigma70/sigma32)
MLSGMGAKRNYRWWVISQMKQHGAVDIAAMRKKFGGLPKSTDDELRAMVVWLLSRSDASLDAPKHDTPDSPTLLDTLAAPADVGPGSADTVDAFLRRVGIEFAPREEAVLRRRLLAEEPETLQAVGDAFGLTRERARQIEARALGKLRQFLRRRPEMLGQLRPSQRARVEAALAGR